MEPAPDPVATSTFPWARIGLVAGLVIAVPGAVLHEMLEVLARVPPAPAVVIERAAPQVEEEEREQIDVPAARQAASFAPIDVPWPPGPRSSSSDSRGGGRTSSSGDSALTRDEADEFFERALAPCSPTRAVIGKAVAWTCESARDESRAFIVPRASGTGTWLQTARRSFSLPSAPGTSLLPPTTVAPTCGAPLRFVALPANARVSMWGGGERDGLCTFDVDGRAAVTWSTMLRNIFRPGTGISKRALDDGTITRWTGEAWDGDSWWRIDVVSASPSSPFGVAEQRARVTIERWGPDIDAWAPPVLFEQKIEALEGCWEPCALALRGRTAELTRVNAGHVALLDRCLYECKGTEEAPAVHEPATSAIP